jgi:hypothetical protein
VCSDYPQDWIAHMEAKAHHFSAVSEYRESIVEYEASRSAFKPLLTRNFLLTYVADTEWNSLVLPRRWLRPRKPTVSLLKAS